MTYLLILSFSFVVWLSRGTYEHSIPFLTLLFLFWVCTRLFQVKKFESELNHHRFFQLFPWMGSGLMAYRSDLLSIDEGRKVISTFGSSIPFVAVLISYWKKKTEWALALLFLFAYSWILWGSPQPHIDVFLSNTSASDFFLQGLNPYAQTYSDIYSGLYDYHPGFVYWPGALYLQSISRFIFGDIRVVLMLAWWSAPFFFPRHSPLSSNKLGWWCLPFLAYGLEQAWLDPLLSFCGALALWSIHRKNWIALSIAIAVAASVKQYGCLIGIFALPFLWSERKLFWKTLTLSGVLFMIAITPFLIASFHDFISMTITTHADAKVRMDALNFTAFWIRWTKLPFPAAAQAAMTLLGFSLAGFHLARNKIQLGLSVLPECWAIAFGFSTLFGKFSFCNYHWLLLSFCWMALSWSRNKT